MIGKTAYLFNPKTADHLGIFYVSLDLSDGYLSKSYSFTVIIYNDSPFFAIGPKNQTVSLDGEKSYFLPKPQDLEFLPIRTRVYFIEYKFIGA